MYADIWLDILCRLNHMLRLLRKSGLEIWDGWMDGMDGMDGLLRRLFVL